MESCPVATAAGRKRSGSAQRSSGFRLFQGFGATLWGCCESHSVPEGKSLCLPTLVFVSHKDTHEHLTTSRIQKHTQACHPHVHSTPGPFQPCVWDPLAHRGSNFFAPLLPFQGKKKSLSVFQPRLTHRRNLPFSYEQTECPNGQAGRQQGRQGGSRVQSLAFHVVP